MKTVAQLLKSKSKQLVATVAPSASACSAAQLMAENGVGALLVMEDGQIVGIVSERDFARKLVPYDRLSREVKVAEIMTSPVMYVDSTQTSEDCMALMTMSRLRHLPVMEQGQLLGLVSIGDLVKEVTSDQHFTIEQLVHYITDKPL